MQNGFSVLSVALASQALTLTASLVDDLASDVTSVGEEPTAHKIEPASFDLFQPFTPAQRVALIFHSVPFVQMLFSVAVVAYRKSCAIRWQSGKAMQYGRKFTA